MTRSFSVRSRKSTVTTTLMRPRTLAAALSLVFLATVIGGVPQDAQGFVPGTYTPAAGTDPTVVVDVSHTPTSPEPKQGETYTYKALFTLGNMTEPGATNQVVLTVMADPNAPWTSVPVAADFVSAFGTPTLTNCTTTSCTATYPNITTNGTITFTHAAKVGTAPTVGDGTLIVGSATAAVNTAPTVKLTNVSQTAFPGQCAGTYTFEQKVGASGAWLVDMKFADVMGDGKVILTPDESTQIRAWDDPAAEGDTIKVTSGTTDMTPTVMATTAVTYRSTDPSSPFYIGLDPLMQTKFANADWLDSLNWRYDPDTWTGNIWLPAGAKIEVKREVTYLGCLPGGITGDGTTNREFGIQTEIARANTTVTGSDFDSFSTPGYRTPASCATSMFVSKNPASTPTTFVQWNPGSSQTSLGSVGIRSDAIAAEPSHPTWLWYMTQTGALSVFDTVAKKTLTTTGTTNTPAGAAMASGNALAFAPDGTLWAASNSQLYWLSPTEVATYLSGGTVTWHQGVVLQRTGTTNPSAINDIGLTPFG